MHLNRKCSEEPMMLTVLIKSSNAAKPINYLLYSYTVKFGRMAFSSKCLHQVP